jgi:hypothetical protein
MAKASSNITFWRVERPTSNRGMQNAKREMGFSRFTPEKIARNQNTSICVRKPT